MGNVYIKLMGAIFSVLLITSISAIVVWGGMAYLTAYAGITISEKLHNIIMLIAILGAYSISMRRVLNVLKNFKKLSAKSEQK